ncbi:MAG TPA: asparagine synthase (glutamine-hydrolyzing), partial [Pyrinomonadaceae bacterium]|nr:asparagine synthase (glutamine-hydrolyzing) [Pyrinomonadaceae bacterium]
SPDGAVGVVFNGAIYNFQELRRELATRGFRFKSNTDTEVLVHGYREWGIDGLVRRLRGMFAFGLWDEPKRKLFLVRDRLGVKPLVYSMRGSEIAFASTVRALCSSRFAGEMDEAAVAEFLEFGYITDRRAIYKGVWKVPAATIVEWSDGKLSAREYWSPPGAKESNKVTFDEAVEQAEALFLRAVERRLQADVAVGALLSGGVDSSLVCWAIRKLGGEITAFTVGAPNDPLDETVDARETARSLGIRHRVLEISADDSPDITEMVAAYAEPFACASALGMLRVSRAVRHEATVLLTGDGGDDCFLGYPEHRHLWMAARMAQRLPRGSANLWSLLKKVFPQRGSLRRAASFMDYTTGGLGAVVSHHDGLPFYERHGISGERLRDVHLEQRGMQWSFESARNVLAEFLEYDRHGRFVAEYMTKVDGGTMQHALEARSPFLDQELWEYAAALPFDIRLHRGQLKAVLREIARRRVGERVASGAKRGFGVPVGRWIAGRWRAQVEETLRESILGREGWIRTEKVLEQLKNLQPTACAPNQLWYLYVLENWLRYERSLRVEAEARDQIPVVAPAIESTDDLMKGQEVAG